MRKPYTQLYVHCVWATWNRSPLITPRVEVRLYPALMARCNEVKCNLIAVGGDLDHVHLLVRLAPAIAVATLVKQVKGSSAHLMNHQILPEAEFRWQGAYSAFTISKNAVKKVSEYVHTQKERHADRRTFEEWEQCYLEIDP